MYKFNYCVRRKANRIGSIQK